MKSFLPTGFYKKMKKKIVNMNTLTTVPDACIQPGEYLVLNAPKPGLG